ncbi:hypothetical protein P4O66_016155, partial [Electrophorus voltai]
MDRVCREKRGGSAVQVDLQYMWICSTCGSAVQVDLQYVWICSTGRSAVQLDLQYIWICSTGRSAVCVDLQYSYFLQCSVLKVEATSSENRDPKQLDSPAVEHNYNATKTKCFTSRDDICPLPEAGSEKHSQPGAQSEAFPHLQRLQGRLFSYRSLTAPFCTRSVPLPFSAHPEHPLGRPVRWASKVFPTATPQSLYTLGPPTRSAVAPPLGLASLSASFSAGPRRDCRSRRLAEPTDRVAANADKLASCDHVFREASCTARMQVAPDTRRICVNAQLTLSSKLQLSKFTYRASRRTIVLAKRQRPDEETSLLTRERNKEPKQEKKKETLINPQMCYSLPTRPYPNESRAINRTRIPNSLWIKVPEIPRGAGSINTPLRRTKGSSDSCSLVKRGIIHQGASRKEKCLLIRVSEEVGLPGQQIEQDTPEAGHIHGRRTHSCRTHAQVRT